jgi:hypothetical protein
MTNNFDFLQVYLFEASKHEHTLSLMVEIVIGVVGLIFAMGAFLVWRENKTIARTARSQLELVEAKRDEINKWFVEMQSSLDNLVKAQFKNFSLEIEELRCYQTVIMALDEQGVHAAKIFPALCVLAERPSALYVGLFREIVKRNITPDITERAELGLKRWQESRR